MGFTASVLGLLKYALLSSHMVEALWIILMEMIPRFNVWKALKLDDTLIAAFTG